MSTLTLILFSLLIFVACGTKIAVENANTSQIISTNDNVTTVTDNRTVKKPIFGTTTTTSPTIFNPTPTDSNQQSTETTISALEELIPSATLPNTVALPPPATTIEPHEPVTICGKMGNCYRWFDDQWALQLSGYKKCEARDERRALRYCCIPPKTGL